MPVLAAIRNKLAEARHEDFERWQEDRRRRDEITDQSERLASPMVNTFEYSLQDGSLVTDLGEPLRPVFEDGYTSALDQANLDSKWTFEAVRRGIELQELAELEAFAQNMGEGLRMTSLSLDGSDYEAMRVIAETLGHRLPVDYPGSEAILQNRMWTPEGMVVFSPIPDAVRINGVDIGAYDKTRNKLLVRIVTAVGDPLDEHTGLIDRIRGTYDDVLTQRIGQQHYAGRIQMTNDDAKSFIEKQGDLLDDHMRVVGTIFAATKDKKERNRQMAPHRYNLAAALDDRLNGKKVMSLSDSGDHARSEGKEFDGDCPTPETAESATDQAGRLGYMAEKWSQGQCRNCERATAVWKEKDGGCNVCRDCASAHTATGEAGLKAERQKAITERAKLERAKARAQKIGIAAMKATKKAAPQADEPEYVERLGIGGIVKEELELAGA
jgi:hypothetical protein